MKKFTDFKFHIVEASGHLTEGKMNDLSVSIGDHIDKHIDNYKKHGGAEDLMVKAGHVAKKIAQQHKIKIQHAHNFVRDYMEKRLSEAVVVAEGSNILKVGTAVRVPHKGKMVPGKIVRHDPGKGGYSPAYVVNIGEYESKIVPVHHVKQDVAEGNWSKDRAGNYLNTHTGVRNTSPSNPGEPSNKEKFEYYRKKLVQLKSNPNSFKTHIAHAEKMLKRYSKGEQGVAEGAPELLKQEMPLVRHIEKELEQYGHMKGTPEYAEKFKHAIAFYRKFGNIDAIKQGVAESFLGDIADKIKSTFTPVKEEVDLDEGLQQTLRKYVPGYAKKQIDKKMNAGKFGKTDVDKDANYWRYKKVQDKLKKEEVELTEGRPSQQHPLEGHEYHRKTDAELEYIGKDAHRAAEAMKGHNEKAENKYRDQANDAATVRYFRKKSGTPDWYKKKYGLVKEETELNESVNEKQIKKDLDSGMSHDAVIGKHSNKKFTNTNEIRKVIQKHAWDKRMKKEEVEINERSLTSSEEEKAEDIVKGMKKDKKGFKERYGKRAREVMYATATKLAQNEEVFHEDSIGDKLARQWNRMTKPLEQAKKDINSPEMKRWERDQRLSVGRGTPEDIASKDKETVSALDKTRKDIHKKHQSGIDGKLTEGASTDKYKLTHGKSKEESGLGLVNKPQPQKYSAVDKIMDKAKLAIMGDPDSPLDKLLQKVGGDAYRKAFRNTAMAVRGNLEHKISGEKAKPRYELTSIDNDVKESYLPNEENLDEMTIAGLRTSRDLTKHLKKNGWTLGRTTGGHDVYVHATNKNNIAVPRHKGDIPPGTVRNIIKTAGLHNEEFSINESRKSDIVKRAWKSGKEKMLKNVDDQTNVESISDAKKDSFQKDPEMSGEIVKQ